MLREDGTGRLRVYQVEIKKEYLEDLFWFDAGSVEQEVFAKADDGVICVVTDRPHMIFARLGESVKSVTYVGPLVELPLVAGAFQVRRVTQESPRVLERSVTKLSKLGNRLRSAVDGLADGL